MIVRPFRAWRPIASLAARIPAYPYDVVDAEEARALADGDPYTFLRVVKPEIDLPDDTPPHDPRVYARGRVGL